MAFIPDDAEWYLADIILEITVENDDRNVIHTNTVLVHAKSPDEAYSRAINFGKYYESKETNPEGNLVTTKFRGLLDLNVIYEHLEDGAELVFKEDINVPEEKLQSWLTPKEKLNVFAPISVPENRPDYSSGEITKAYNEYTKK